MKLKLTYKTKDEIPAGFESLYEENGGQFILTGVEGLKSDADIRRLTASLEKERTDHKETKTKLKAFTDLGKEATDLGPMIDRFEELEATNGGKVDDAKIDELVEKRIKTKMAPVTRENQQLKDKVTELETNNTNLQGTIKRGKIADAIRGAALEAKVVDTALEDIISLGERVFDVSEDGAVSVRDGIGFTPGLDAKAWMGDMKTKRPHWWPMSQGGGANGGGDGGAGKGNNPFTDAHWNLTEQGKLVRSNPQEAERQAKMAGTKVGGPRPAKKSA